MKTIENNYFITQKPIDDKLSNIIESYFYIDVSSKLLKLTEEIIIPFPRMTFGYFFDNPFEVTNHSLNEIVLENMIISKISTQKITVKPTTNRVKILGAHVKPYCLAYLTDLPISELPWLIKTEDIFKQKALDFKIIIEKSEEKIESMFLEIGKIFLENILNKDMSDIIEIIELIEKNNGDIKIKELSNKMNISSRTIRNIFHKNIGCSPKEYISLVKLKKIAHNMKFTEKTLTEIAHNNNYFDQSHFINEFKKIIGKSPKIIRKEIDGFRFLQF